MVKIDDANPVVTLINVFTVDPGHQQELVDLLINATREAMQYVPGFVSASIHKSSDGSRVTNYAQWKSAEDFQAMLKNPKALEHMAPIKKLATYDAHLYEVVETIAV